MDQPTHHPKLKGMAISDIAIRNPVFIAMLMLLAVIIGLLAYSNLPVNYLPDFSMPTVAVRVTYSGAGPETIAQEVTQPIEEAINTLNGIDEISSTSSEGSSQIIVQFNEDVDVDQGLLDVREKVNGVLNSLPDDVGDPVYQKFDPNSQAILQVAIASTEGRSGLELRTLIDDTISPQLQKITGVGSVDVSGGLERQINVELDPARMESYQITAAQVSSAISGANSSLGIGSITSGDQTINVRSPSLINSVEDIANVAIPGTTYHVSDVATVTDGTSEASSYSRLDGEDAISLGVVKQSGSNTVQVAEQSLAELEKMLADYPDLNYIVTSNEATEITSSVETSIEEILISVIAAFLVVLFFFRNLRTTIVTVAGLPIIIIFTFWAMSYFGVSINLISLLAITLSVGLVIDDAIVVRENIFRYQDRGFSAWEAASRGTAQVTLSVLAMTLTIIAVFLPVTLTTGITGFIFKAFGITVASAMAISLVEAFTFAPMLSAHLFPSHKKGVEAAPPADLSEHEDLLDEAKEPLNALGRFYAGILNWSLHHRWVIVVSAVVILVISGLSVRGMSVEFLPSQASDNFNISFTMPQSTSLEATDRIARQAEDLIRQDPDVVALQTRVGGSSNETGSFTIRVRDSETADVVRERLRPQLSFLPGVIFGARSFGGGSGTGVGSRNIQIQLQSSRTLRELAPYAEQIQQVMENTTGAVDVGTSYETGRPEVEIAVNKAKASVLGISNSDLASTLRTLINGNTASTLRKDGEEVSIVVRLSETVRADAANLRAISISTSQGSIPLGSIADISIGAGPTSISRTGLQNEIVIGANVAEGSNQQEVQAQITAAVQQLDFPSNITVVYGGDQQNLNEGFGSLFIAMGLSVLFVYMVLAAQFNSFLQPLVIMLAMPFSFLGAFVALRIAGESLGITALIGLIMLLGLVVKNSILLVDFTNRLRAAGLEKDEAIEVAGAIRLRPILMTSIAIIAGAIPTAFGIHFLSSGSGSEFRRGLAIVLIGGMLTSTLLTLLFVPTAYSLLESFKAFVWRLRHRRTPPTPPPATTSTPVTPEG